MTPAVDKAPVAGRALASWIFFALTAGLALVALWLGLQIASLRTENVALNTDRERAEIAFKTAQAQLKERSFIAERMINDLGRQLREKGDLRQLKIVTLAPPAGNSTGSSAIAVWDPARQTGLLTVRNLPAAAEDQHYAFWILGAASNTPVTGGALKVGPDGAAVLTFSDAQTITPATAYFISLEKNDGSVKAPGLIVLEGRQ